MGLIPSTHSTVAFGRRYVWPDPWADTDAPACPAVARSNALLTLLLHIPSPGKQIQTLRSNTEAENFAAILCGCLGGMPRAHRFVSINFRDGLSQRCVLCSAVHWSHYVHLSLSVSNCPLAFDIELLLVWHRQELMNFKFSGFQLLINRSIYYIFLELCHGI